MKIQCKLALIVCGFSPFSVWAATHYVWQSSPGPAPPYTNWVTAATNIQQAVDAAVAGDDMGYLVAHNNCQPIFVLRNRNKAGIDNDPRGKEAVLKELERIVPPGLVFKIGNRKLSFVYRSIGNYIPSVLPFPFAEPVV